MVLLGIESRALIRGGGCIADTNIVLNEPFVDCLEEIRLTRHTQPLMPEIRTLVAWVIMTRPAKLLLLRT